MWTGVEELQDSAKRGYFSYPQFVFYVNSPKQVLRANFLRSRSLLYNCEKFSGSWTVLSLEDDVSNLSMSFKTDKEGLLNLRSSLLIN